MLTAKTTQPALFHHFTLGRDLMTESRSLPPFDPVRGAPKSHSLPSPERKLPGIDQLLSAPPPPSRLSNSRSTELPSPPAIIAHTDRYPPPNYARTESYPPRSAPVSPFAGSNQSPLAPMSRGASTSSYPFGNPGSQAQLSTPIRPSHNDVYPFRPSAPPSASSPQDGMHLGHSPTMLSAPTNMIGSPDPRTHSGGGPNATAPVRKVLGSETIPGEGPCWVYEDGTYIRKEIDGEPVNAQWGVTKAGKPRKRLAMACKTCREKKIKCEPADPKCAQCERSGRECRYETAYVPFRSTFPTHATKTPDSIAAVRKLTCTDATPDANQKPQCISSHEILQEEG